MIIPKTHGDPGVVPQFHFEVGGVVWNTAGADWWESFDVALMTDHHLDTSIQIPSGSSRQVIFSSVHCNSEVDDDSLPVWGMEVWTNMVEWTFIAGDLSRDVVVWVYLEK